MRVTRFLRNAPRAAFRVLPTGLLVAMSLAGTGCTTYEHAERDVARAIADWQRGHVFVPPQNAAPPVAAEHPAAGPAATLDRYIARALERNPSLQAAQQEARARLERIPQVTSLPDPVLRALVRPEPLQTAAGDARFTLSVSQVLPLPARLERLGEAAAAEVRMAVEQLNARRLAVIADVERAYWQVYLLDRNLELTSANRRLLEDLAQVVTTQYQVGQVPQQDVLRVQNELAKLRDDEHRDLMRRQAAAAALNRLMADPPAQPVAQTEPAALAALRFDVQRLTGLAEDNNPELAALDQQLARDRAKIAHARLGYWPDLMIGFEWNYLEGRPAFIPPVNPETGRRPAVNRMSEAGDDNWAITAQVNLPIWTQRIEAAKREARRRLLATQAERAAAQDQIALRVFDAWSRVAAEQETVAVLESTLIPQARQTYEVTLAGYQAGDEKFVTLIDNWRRWLDFELMRHREMVDLHVALADLQRAVGLELVRGTPAAAQASGEHE